VLLTKRKSGKCDYWCCLFALPCLLVELTCFHQYIGATVTVTTNTLVEDEGFLLAKYLAELLLIGCMACFDKKKTTFSHMGCIPAKKWCCKHIKI
jgi:hypothetical protein